MKHAIIIIALAAGLAHGQFNVVVSPTNITGGSLHYLETNNITPPTDRQIQKLIVDGSVCRVRGKHEWEFIIESKEGLIISYDNNRKCIICGRKEVKTQVWEEEKQ